MIWYPWSIVDGIYHLIQGNPNNTLKDATGRTASQVASKEYNEDLAKLIANFTPSAVAAKPTPKPTPVAAKPSPIAAKPTPVTASTAPKAEEIGIYLNSTIMCN
jgi:hypothetical protein